MWLINPKEKVIIVTLTELLFQIDHEKLISYNVERCDRRDFK